MVALYFYLNLDYLYEKNNITLNIFHLLINIFDYEEDCISSVFL
jgi:hypothetical protein